MPVVAIKAGGVGEIVRPGETGELVDRDQPYAEFAEAVARLIDDRVCRKSLAVGALAYARSQSWDEIMETLRTHYEAVISQGAPSR